VIVPATITFTGICDFTRDATPGNVIVYLPNGAHPRYTYLTPHIAYLKVRRNQADLTHFQETPGLGDAAFAVAAVTGAITLGGTFSGGPCDSAAMETPSQISDMRTLSGVNFPNTASAVASISISKGVLAPYPPSTLHWGYGIKGSPAPANGVSLSGFSILTLTPTGASFTIETTSNGYVRFASPYNVAAEIGCLEQGDILYNGTYVPKAEDIDFLFHYLFTPGGMNDQTNLIPIAAAGNKKKRHSKRVDCFAARWF
jgi:hypothetical protein